MSINIIVISLAIIAYICLRLFTRNISVTRRVVFAGSPSFHEMTSNYQSIPIPRNYPQYKLGDKKVNISNFEQLVVSGKSLERFGIKDGSILFVRKIGKEKEIKEEFLKGLIGHFVVFKIDNERILQEYPLKNIVVAEGGLKLRKALLLLEINNSKDNAKLIEKFLEENDDEFKLKSEPDKKNELEKYIKKYSFAATYYSNDKFLIMSITYKNGEYKDYSFHSPEWLYGVVEYNTLK